MSDKIGFAIIGCGNIAPFHVQGIKSCPQAALVAVADTDQGQAERLVELYPSTVVFTDYLNMLKLPEVEVVCVCTPSSTHPGIVIEAARAGKHVICEKPLGTNLEKIDKAIEICRSQKIKLTTIAQSRTNGDFQKVREAVSGGELGRMIFGDCYMKFYRSPAYYKNAGWRATWEIAGGGALMNQGIHGLDILRWVMGEVKSVCAKSNHIIHDIQVDDTTVALLEFESGAYGVLQVSTSTNPGEPCQYLFHGDRGTIALSESGIKRWATAGKSGVRAKDSSPPAQTTAKGGKEECPEVISGHTAQICDMAAAIKEDRDPLVTPEDARADVALALAIYESARSGKEVKIK